MTLDEYKQTCSEVLDGLPIEICSGQVEPQESVIDAPAWQYHLSPKINLMTKRRTNYIRTPFAICLAALFCLTLSITSPAQDPLSTKKPDPDEASKQRREVEELKQDLQELFKTGKRPARLEGKSDREIYYEILKSRHGYVHPELRHKFLRAPKEKSVEGQYCVQFTYDIHEAIADEALQSIVTKYGVELIGQFKSYLGVYGFYKGLTEKQAQEISEDPHAAATQYTLHHRL